MATAWKCHFRERFSTCDLVSLLPSVHPTQFPNGAVFSPSIFLSLSLSVRGKNRIFHTTLGANIDEEHSRIWYSAASDLFLIRPDKLRNEGGLLEITSPMGSKAMAVKRSVSVSTIAVASVMVPHGRFLFFRLGFDPLQDTDASTTGQSQAALFG